MSEIDALIFDPWGPLESLLSDYNDADLTTSVFANAGVILPRPTGDAAYSHKTRNRFYLAAAREAYQGMTRRSDAIFSSMWQLIWLRRPEWADRLNEALRRIGWMLVGDAIIPLELLDPHDLAFVPDAARPDLVKAADRISTDPAGAVTAACGAIDSVTEDIYQRYNLGNHRTASFEERVSRSLTAMGIIGRLSKQLQETGWDQKKGEELCERLGKAIGHNAFVMATLRSKMSDAHGSKPTIDALAFNSVKWATIICSMLNERMT
jgi:hypothetical protein